MSDDMLVEREPVCIYALADPRNNSIRYVGKSTDPKQRLFNHVHYARFGRKGHLCNWLRSLLAVGMRPNLLALEWCEPAVWKVRETYWITTLRATCNLTNCTDGGDGTNPSAELRAHFSAIRKGRTPWNKGRPHSPETIKKLKAASQLRYAKLRALGPIPAMNKGIPCSEIAKKRNADSQRSRWENTPEAERLKQGEKISRAQLRSWASMSNEAKQARLAPLLQAAHTKKSQGHVGS